MAILHLFISFVHLLQIRCFILVVSIILVERFVDKTKVSPLYMFSAFLSNNDRFPATFQFVHKMCVLCENISYFSCFFFKFIPTFLRFSIQWLIHI